MNQYTIYCTEEQTMKALALGAQIEYIDANTIFGKLKPKHSFYVEIPFRSYKYYLCPTAEQMIGWLRVKHNIRIELYTVGGIPIYDVKHNTTIKNDSMFEHNLTYSEIYIANTLAAIDAALEYLTKNKA